VLNGSSKQNARSKQELGPTRIDFYMTAIGHLINEAQKTRLVRLQSKQQRVVTVGSIVGSNVAQQQWSMTENGHNDALTKLNRSIVKSQRLVIGSTFTAVTAAPLIHTTSISGSHVLMAMLCFRCSLAMIQSRSNRIERVLPSTVSFFPNDQ
jgi:hypothetical protein